MTLWRKNALMFLVAITAVGCQRADDTKLGEKLDKIIAQNEQILGKMAAGGGPAGARPQMPERKRPNPTEVYAVPVGKSTVIGNPNAKITVIEAFEFACPFCEKVRPTIAELQKKYGDDIRFVPKQYVVHPPVATQPARLACAASKQGKYEKVTELLWEKGFKASRNFSPENIDAIGKEGGLDMTKAKAELADGSECAKQIQEEMGQLSAVGVSGTPAFLVNGRFISGAQPLENFVAVIDDELKKYGERIGKDGVTAENYYEKMVMEKGKKKLE